jgi:hypothetical protein
LVRRTSSIRSVYVRTTWSCMRLWTRCASGPNSDVASDDIASIVPSDSEPVITAFALTASTTIGASVDIDE